MSFDLKNNTFKNDYYRFIRTAIISFYTKCMKEDSDYYKKMLISEHIEDYLKFFEKMYLSFYKEQN